MSNLANYAPPYGQGTYGLPRVYGVQLYTPYTVEAIGGASNFTAQSVDYSTILLRWSPPQVPAGVTITDYRLLQNRYGFPVDQNDGTVLLDSSVYFGSQYKDQNVIPGTYHYYGFYLQLSTGSWIRAGFTSCLAIADYGSGDWLFRQLPEYFQSTQFSELTTDATGNQYLQQFLNVIGWGLDYLKTQYDRQFDTLNSPMQMSLRDLYNLAGQMGIPFQSEVPASVMRKAVANWTTVSQQRGTVTGIGAAVSLLTGYGTDLQTGINKLLDNDQSGPVSPVYEVWNSERVYTSGELVTYQGTYLYKAIATSLNQAPSGTTGSNSWWSCLQDAADPGSTLANSSSIGVAVASGGNNTGTASTMEAIYAGQAVNYVPPSSGTLAVGVGEPVVGSTSVWQGHTFRVTNKAATAQAVWLRSVARAPSDLNSANWVPDAQQVVNNGIPVPAVTSRNQWASTKRYATNSLVTSGNMTFRALRASTGAVPPIVGEALNTNAFFSSGATGWTFVGFGTPSTSTTVTSASGISFTGSTCLALPVTNGTVNPNMKSSTFNVIPGALYVFTFWVQSPSTFTSTAQVSVSWTGPGSQASTTSGAATTIGSPVNTFTQVTYTVAAPSFATSAAVTLTLVQSFAGAFTFYVSKGIAACYATPEWAPVSRDGRLRYMVSGKFSQSLLVGTNQTTAVTPFVEWYDQGGTFIQRVAARTATPGTAAPPANLNYDSFTTQPGATLAGRTLDSELTQWSGVSGQFLLGGFSGGCAYPAVAGSTSMALVTGTANGFAAATFTTFAQAPLEQGVIFRYSSAGNYFHAGPTQLWICQSGVFSSLGTYSQALQPGDRLYVQMNGSAITISRNSTQVLSVTNSTFSTAVLCGIAVEQV